MSNKALDTKTETEVVAYMARGDTYETIIDTLAKRDLPITKGTLSNIKKRNAETLQFMQSTMAEQEISAATSILRKSRKLLENKLDYALSYEDEMEAIKQLLIDGDIDREIYWEMTRERWDKQLSVSELNSVTKEAFNQSQVEQGKPSSITENPTQMRANLQVLLNAISNGDDQAALAAIFPDD